MKIYLDRLPNPKNVKKINAAIGFETKVEPIDVFYIDPVDIKKFVLPDFLRGCNTINKPHQEALFWLKVKGAEHLMKRATVMQKSFRDIGYENFIGEIEYLKIDGEGSDLEILMSAMEYFEDVPSALPKRIKFEHQHSDVNNLITTLRILTEKYGYRAKKLKYDYLLTLLHYIGV